MWVSESLILISVSLSYCSRWSNLLLMKRSLDLKESWKWLCMLMILQSIFTCFLSWMRCSFWSADCTFSWSSSVNLRASWVIDWTCWLSFTIDICSLRLFKTHIQIYLICSSDSLMSSRNPIWATRMREFLILLLFFFTCLLKSHRNTFWLLKIIYNSTLVLSLHVFLLRMLFHIKVFKSLNIQCLESLYSLHILEGLNEQKLLLQNDLTDRYVFCKAVCDEAGVQIAHERKMIMKWVWYQMKKSDEITGFEQVTHSYILHDEVVKVFNKSCKYLSYFFSSVSLFLLCPSSLSLNVWIANFVKKWTWVICFRTWCFSTSASIHFLNTIWIETSLLTFWASIVVLSRRKCWWEWSAWWADSSICVDFESWHLSSQDQWTSSHAFWKCLSELSTWRSAVIALWRGSEAEEKWSISEELRWTAREKTGIKNGVRNMRKWMRNTTKLFINFIMRSNVWEFSSNMRFCSSIERNSCSSISSSSFQNWWLMKMFKMHWRDLSIWLWSRWSWSTWSWHCHQEHQRWNSSNKSLLFISSAHTAKFKRALSVIRMTVVSDQQLRHEHSSKLNWWKSHHQTCSWRQQFKQF